MTSINTMVKRVAGMLGTDDLTDWEEDFVTSINAQTHQGDNTSSLTEKQIESLERIFNKHFAG